MAARLLNINKNGNKKLVNNSNTRFIIWNLPAVVTCPYRTANCEKLCYALKAEKVYPTVKPARVSNFEESRKDDFVENMIFTLETAVNSKAYAGKQVVVRIHESGDFYNETYTKKWLAIASYMSKYSNVVFMAYTKSLVYFEGKTIPDNMVIRASVWDDSKPDFLQKVKEGNYPIYTAVKSFDDYTGAKCRCEDCAKCGLCWNKQVKNIACEIH